MAFAGAAVAVSAALSYYQGEKQASAQRKSLRAQQQGERESAALASASQRQAEMEQRRANRQEPDVDSLLANEKKRAMQGASSTMLTAPNGRPRLLGGQQSTLGGGGV